MRKYEIFAALGVAVFSLGCTKQSASDHAAQVTQNIILRIKHEMGEGRSGYDRREGRRLLAKQVGEISNTKLRKELADMFAATVLGFDFSKLTYQKREDSARYYFDHLSSLLEVMRSAGCPPEQMLDAFFSGMAKFREACLGVPLAAKASHESLVDYSWRTDCARKLYGEYAQRMSEIQRFWLPRLSAYLPDESHQEFRRLIKPFLEFPTEQEFRRAPMFSGGCSGGFR